MDDVRLTRRRSLLSLGGLVVAAIGAGGWKKASAGPAGVASGRVACILTPELTEGPYYIAGERVRRDITEGKKGAPLMLALTVVDASTCRPISGASVDIWHSDALGAYSGFGAGAASRTFLRGIQKTDAHGVARFKTIYPGWYPGRTVHIHVKVHLGGAVIHTGQLFFSDALTDKVYRGAPYKRRPNRSTRNASDAIYVNGGRKSVLKVHKQGAVYHGSIAMGVMR